MDEGRVIGRDNRVPWRIPEDLSRLRTLSWGHPIIMGRKTHESIGRPLPGRTNIVITRDREYRAPGCVVVHSLEDALAQAGRIEREEVFIFGGGEIFREALPLADRLYLTIVEGRHEGDTIFPEYAGLFSQVRVTGEGEHEGLRYRFLELDR